MKRKRKSDDIEPDWPRGPYAWFNDGITLYISIPFTWNLPQVREYLQNGNLLFEHAVVGGPALNLMPDFFSGMDYVTVGISLPGVLQRVHPMATRTTTGCIRKCGFCGVGTEKIEAGGLVELEDWPDLPIICDNNLLAASQGHFDRVIDRLKKWRWADFNQGIDSRLLTEYHAKRLSEIKKPLIRLALDSMAYRDSWERAVDMLKTAGIAKSNIRSYALIGFNNGPDEAWERCRYIEKHVAKACPMWFHRLDALENNTVTDEQAKLGWDDEKRKDIMKFYYQHTVRANRTKDKYSLTLGY